MKWRYDKYQVRELRKFHYIDKRVTVPQVELSDERKILFVENIIFGLPSPSLVFQQSRNGDFTVIEGAELFLSLIWANPMAMERPNARRFEDTQINVIVLEYSGTPIEPEMLERVRKSFQK
jgi:hypothetical protein